MGAGRLNMNAPIFCVNLKKSDGRRERMTRRFRNCNMIDRVTFVEAIDSSDPIIDQHAVGITENSDDLIWRKTMGCFLGHLKAVRTFLETTDETVDGAIICEDDILLHNNFDKRFLEAWNNLDESPTLILFGYMMSSWENANFRGKNRDLGNLVKITKFTWGAQAYWISRAYAKEALERYTRPFKELNEKDILKSSEVIIRCSEGYFVYPPIVIEDGIDSDRAPNDLPAHRKHFEQWGYSNFSACDSPS